MSDEVLTGSYIWMPPDPQRQEMAEDEVEGFDALLLTDPDTVVPSSLNPAVPSIGPESKSQSETKIGFIQNYIHDAESLWWILCWFLLATGPVSLPVPSDQAQSSRQAKLQQFFSKSGLCCEEV